ncbi:hypothetical protein H9X81_00775 [Hydrogenoanaerobacterium saccharovorans]|uniref:Uncharacterized protein n=1 Tax=Hydrogenoanaerobacterium saccharovorans TaxID=474960 RepID=A0ABS2GL15_9FIRM|nr:hypothetical protein [Hydrogenoanaerobacterium saccharovorans]MBM6922228.1 hypothetical protein [Hydrogenoanaerobacterium saccharovorans]MBS5633701.1 hypothetical protein [Clostridiales bacterium]HIY80981.1 hypothetical protein [Bacillota bacterium]
MQQLAEEYLHSAELLDQRIRQLRGSLDQLYGKEYLHALRRIDLLRQEYYETRAVGLYLLRHS